MSLLKENIVNKFFGETVSNKGDFLNADPKINARPSHDEGVKISKISEKRRSKGKKINGKLEKFDPKMCPNFDTCKGKGNSSNKTGKRHFLLKNCPYVLSESDRNDLNLINNLELNSLKEVKYSWN